MKKPKDYENGEILMKFPLNLHIFLNKLISGIKFCVNFKFHFHIFMYRLLRIFCCDDSITLELPIRAIYTSVNLERYPTPNHCFDLRSTLFLESET